MKSLQLPNPALQRTRAGGPRLCLDRRFHAPMRAAELVRYAAHYARDHWKCVSYGGAAIANCHRWFRLWVCLA